MQINKNEIWAFVPARSGSKKIIHKNIKKLNGKPLIVYTFDLIKKLNFIKKTIFSSDSLRYIKIAKKNINCEIHKRSKWASSDSATDLDVFKEFIKEMKKKNHNLPEYFLHLRPTTPIRRKKIVQNAINFFLKNNKKYTSLRSVSELTNPAFKAVTIKKKYLYSPFYKNYNIDSINKPRHFYPKTFLPNGYVDVIKTKNLFKNSLHGNKAYPYLILDYNSDIDTLMDFKITEIYLKYLNGNI